MMRRADGSVTTIALTPGQEQELGLAVAEDDGPHGYYADLAARVTGPYGQRDAEAAEGPDGAFGSPPTSYRTPFRVYDVGSTGDGENDERTEAEVARLLKQARRAFNSKNYPVDSGTRSYGPSGSSRRSSGPPGRPQSYR